jgi:hypothetical protein
MAKYGHWVRQTRKEMEKNKREAQIHHIKLPCDCETIFSK